MGSTNYCTNQTTDGKGARRQRPTSIPSALDPAGVTVLVDSRERNPFDLTPLRMITGSLATGDYTARGLENHIAVERKSLGDLIACCAGERDRFERELQRLLAFPCRCVIVEGSWSELEAGNWRSKITPQSVTGSVLAWIGAGVPFLFCGTRESAQAACGRLLFAAARRRYREIRGLLAPFGEEVGQ